MPSLHFVLRKLLCRSFFTLFFLLIISPLMAGSGTIYVDSSATGLNNGISWTDAITDLQVALDSARNTGADSILVAEGTYTPDAVRNSPDSSFRLIDGVKMLGGYPSGGGARDPSVYITRLSGNIGNPAQSFDNSYQVITGVNLGRETVLDGFFITGGYGFGNFSNGGGMYLISSSPIIRNCTFFENNGLNGGATHIRQGSTPSFVNCKWMDNLAGNKGGGLYNRDSHPSLFNCVFERNTAQVDGGGMAGGESDALVVNTLFTTNTAFINGGGMYNDTCDVRAINCTFHGNSVFSKGGGMFNLDSNPFIGNCIFWGDNNGFGTEIDDFASATYVFNSIVQGGYVTPSGQGVNVSTLDPLFVSAPTDLRLDPSSPARNFGYFQFVPPDSLDADANGNPVEKVPDLDGNLRVNCGEVDLGVFEFQEPPPVLFLGTDTIICPGDTVLLRADPGQNYPGAAFSWSTGASQPTITASDPGDYWVTLTDSNCASTDSIRILEFPVSPVTFSGLDQNFCPGDTSLLIPSDTTGGNWFFSGAGVTSGGLYIAGSPGLQPIIFFYEDSLTCIASDTQMSRVLPVISTYPYFEDYETGEGSWYAEGMNASWEYGEPAGLTISTAASGDSAWVTRLLGNYNPGERSYVYSPFFNLSGVERPFVSFQYFNVTEPGRDGTVLQVSTDQGLTWENVDFDFTGLNWFNVLGITGQPGAPFNPDGAGWSGMGMNWENARIRLDSLGRMPKVQFRFAFASDLQTVFEGFAFDDFLVRERNKVILLEQFSHSSVPLDTDANSWMSTMRDNNEDDLVALHYHIFQSGLQPDPMYLDNPGDVSDRSNFYGVSGAPFSVVDGNYYLGTSYEIPQGHVGWGQEEVDIRVTEVAPFEIEILDLEVDAAADTLSCTARFTHTGDTVFADSLRFFFAVVERNIDAANLSGVVNPDPNYEWVMKKILPNTSGIPIFGNWNPGSFLDFSVSWEFEDVYDVFELGVVVFAQNPVTREIYQAAYLENDLVISRESGTDTKARLLLYPVPAHDQINVVSREIAIEQVVVLNQLGQPVSKPRIGTSHHVQLPVEGLPEGIYFVRVRLKNGEVVIRKVIVQAY